MYTYELGTDYYAGPVARPCYNIMGPDGKRIATIYDEDEAQALLSHLNRCN